ncbi:hypothetical protein [Phycicoccus sp. 3266]|uniref:hypothetical protein n=1 Tax=Phycicoccus sp. 3266 TaxID=2817751 RepID=UPI00285BEBED|nr:hypothetical protein [Phycicoccus sp. 3266]MDR6862156.1 hypothetical protein [Phycicoccus sp. 3266]
MLCVDLTPAVDDFGFLDTRAASMIALNVPAGVRVELNIGQAKSLVDITLGELIRAVRPAREVVVIGNHAAGVGALVGALRVAFARKDSAA